MELGGRGWIGELRSPKRANVQGMECEFRSCDSTGDTASDSAPAPASRPSPSPPGPSLTLPRCTAGVVSPPPTSPRMRWADLAEDNDRAAGHPGERRAPQLMRRRCPNVGDGSTALSQMRPHAGAVPATRGRQNVALGVGAALRRHAQAWGVAGRSNIGRAGASSRAALVAVPRSSLQGVSATAWPASQPSGSSLSGRRPPFRPFITAFGSSSLRYTTPPPSVRRPWLALVQRPSPAVARLVVARTLAALLPHACRVVLLWAAQSRAAPAPPRKWDQRREPSWPRANWPRGTGP